MLSPDVPEKPKRTQFQMALMRERARLQISRREIANLCGIDQRTVKRWEDGESIPSVQQFKRLVGLLRRVAPHPPQWGWTAGALADGRFEEKMGEMRETVKQLEQVDPTPRPEPQDFGTGLRRLREENEISLDQLAEVLGVSGASIGFWERGETLPVKENLDKLFQVMPELEVGMQVGSIKRPESKDIPKPIGPEGMKFPNRDTSGVDTMLAMSRELYETESKRAPAVKPRWSQNDIPPDHEHRYEEQTEYDIASPQVPRKVRRCAICGVPEQTAIVTVTAPEHQHSDTRVRCPRCQGAVKLDPGVTRGPRLWVCENCRVLHPETHLDHGEPVAHPVRRNSVTELAEAYGRARVQLARAKAQHSEAQRALDVAQEAVTKAAAEVDSCEKLLDLAVQEETGT